eukprot:gene33664-5088_t
MRPAILPARPAAALLLSALSLPAAAARGGDGRWGGCARSYRAALRHHREHLRRRQLAAAINSSHCAAGDAKGPPLYRWRQREGKVLWSDRVHRVPGGVPLPPLTMAASAPEWDFAAQRWTQTCASVCPRGFTYDESQAQWDGSRWSYNCVEAVCPANAVTIQVGNGAVECRCEGQYEGDPLWNPALLRWDHQCGPGRSSILCPEGSGPEGVCECYDGYRTVGSAGPGYSPRWDGVRWSHSCQRAPCPANAQWGLVPESDVNVPGGYYACVCMANYCGWPVWSITRQQWTHTCRSCPTIPVPIIAAPVMPIVVPIPQVVTVCPCSGGQCLTAFGT